jgi:hypothetical protein
MDEQRMVAWTEATWLNPPLTVEPDGADLVVSSRTRATSGA